MPRKSAGLLCYRFAGGKLQVLLLHPGGPFWAKKDPGAWSIPKGEFDDNEPPLEAAKREAFEETGIRIDGAFIELSPVKQKSGKQVFAWALEYDLDPAAIKSNLFEMEWPPHSGKKSEFPEIDKAAWFTIDEAKQKIIEGQIPLIDQLLEKLQ
jgi:predicted NUDIX family NTP pyrophosphohydrolase